MKPLVYHHAAEEEFLEAVRRGEAERPGRRLRLDALVQKAEQQIQRYSHSGSRHIRGTRRLVLPKFPYAYDVEVSSDYFPPFTPLARRVSKWGSGSSRETAVTSTFWKPAFLRNPWRALSLKPSQRSP